MGYCSDCSCSKMVSRLRSKNFSLLDQIRIQLGLWIRIKLDLWIRIKLFLWIQFQESKIGPPHQEKKLRCVILEEFSESLMASIVEPERPFLGVWFFYQNFSQL
jgi:hypothetical protein